MAFNIRLNNHRKDLKRIDAIPAIRHFSQTGHNFEHDAKFTISAFMVFSESGQNKPADRVKYIGNTAEELSTVSNVSVHL